MDLSGGGNASSKNKAQVSLRVDRPLQGCKFFSIRVHTHTFFSIRVHTHISSIKIKIHQMHKYSSPLYLVVHTLTQAIMRTDLTLEPQRRFSKRDKKR